MKAYFISGLAADRRAFQFIQLPAGYEAVFLDWIKPLKNESLKSYANRMAKSIDAEKPFILIGLSMGGMLATEIAKTYKPTLTILISSATSNQQFPPWFKLAGWLRLYKILPAGFFKSASLLKRVFTNETKDIKAILRQVIKDSDPVFIQWAIGAILHWKNVSVPSPLFQVHGSKDELLPVKYSKAEHIIKNGSHLMVLSKAEEINNLLNKALVSLEKNSAYA